MELSEIVKNLKPQERHLNDHILIIDGLNTFLRSFSVINTINSKGFHIGGLVGFLKSLGVLNRMFNPTRIIIAWDGKGGASNRKNVNPNYKSQREHTPVIHWDMYNTKEEEIESMQDQIERLWDYLEYLPVTLISIDKLEADDIIAYLAKSAGSTGHKVTVVSMDKDFLQLVSENIEVYSPVQKILYEYRTTVDRLGVLPENYNIVKALVGDKSDNLAGVKGIGIKTLVKMFPDLSQNPDYTLQNLYDDCSKGLGTKPKYASILNEWSKVESNYGIMDLHETVLDEREKEIVYARVKAKPNKLMVGPFLVLLDQDCIEGITGDTEAWLSQFNSLQNF